MNSATILIALASQLRFSESILCEVGEALKDPTNPDLDRTCGAGCPNNYYCVQSPSVQAGGVCCPTRASACSLPMANGAYCGTGSWNGQRWYYDPTKSACCPFYYNGCFGNLNNFRSCRECTVACRGAGANNQLCPAGSAVQPGTTAVTPCNMTPFTCLTGYSCTWNAAMQRSYCCSITNPVHLCPSGSTAAPGVTVSTPCRPGTACANSGYSCQQSPSNGFSYCCSTSADAYGCPSGYNAYMPSSQIIVCNSNGVIQPNMCLPAGNCLWSSVLQTNICCQAVARRRLRIGNAGVALSKNETIILTTPTTIPPV